MGRRRRNWSEPETAMKKLIAFILLLVGAGAGWWYWVKYGQPLEKPTIQYATITQGDIVEGVPATGALEPKRRYDVGSQVSGVVKAIYVDYNSIVKKDQLLAEIDPQLLQVQVQIQEANIERQKSDIANQKVQLDDQKRQFERTKSLFERGLQNQQQFEAAELAIKTRESQILSAEKSLVSANANLESARLNVSYTQIKAPADGVIVERRVDVGQTVQASMQTPSFFVLSTPLEELKLTASVDEAEIGKIRPGMEVRFTVDAYGQKPFFGQVENVRLNATNSNNVVTYPVWITVPNPNLELRPAMTATLRIILSTASNVVRVPNQALRFRPNNDIYTALGVTPPAPGGGRNQGPGGSPETNNNQRGEREGQNAQAGTGNTPQNARGGNTQPGQQNAQNTPGGNNQNRNRQGQGGNAPGGQGASAQNGGQPGGNNQNGGRGGNRNFQMTPEQQARFNEMMARGGGAGGRGAGAGGNRGGNNQGRGGRGQMPGAVTSTSPQSKDATKIDEMWAPIPQVDTTGNVWVYDEAKKELNQKRLRLGVTDGTFTQLLSGDVKVGDQVLTSVILPASMRPAANTNPLMGGQQNRGGMQMPGMGGGGGGMGGMGGGGATGGGGGGRGGGGGGGRGGN